MYTDKLSCLDKEKLRGQKSYLLSLMKYTSIYNTIYGYESPDWTHTDDGANVVSYCVFYVSILNMVEEIWNASPRY